MVSYPGTCPKCGADNRSSLPYCSVCGNRFAQPRQKASTGKKLDRKKVSKEQKLKVKKLKKKKELTEKFKSNKITNEQYIMGLRKLGYGADVEKAMAFKKYINQQIQAFEKMEVAPEGMEGQYRFDPNESKAQLPRDEEGNIITDFSVSPTRATSTSSASTPVAEGYVHQAPTINETKKPGSGPVFGNSLFSSGPSKGKEREAKKEIPKAKLVKAEDRKSISKGAGRRKTLDLEWDEDEDEEGSFEVDLDEEEEEFVIEMDKEAGFEGESGWWDDEEWELDWSDEDEDEWEDWDIEEDEWEIIWDEEEDEVEEDMVEDTRVDWEDEEEEEDEFELDEDEEDFELEEEEEEDDNEDDDDDDWGAPIGRRKRRRSR